MTKKRIALVLAAIMALSLTGCTQQIGAQSTPTAQERVDLAAFYETIFADEKADGLALEKRTDDMIAQFYPGLADVACTQLLVYTPKITSVAYEVALAEAANEDDVRTVQDIFQARVDAQVDGGAWYPKTIEQWQNNARIVTNGNYIMLVVGEGSDQVVDDFNALFGD